GRPRQGRERLNDQPPGDRKVPGGFFVVPARACVCVYVTHDYVHVYLCWHTATPSRQMEISIPREGAGKLKTLSGRAMKKASNLRVVRLNRMNAYNAVDARLDRPVYERAAAWELMDLLRNPYNGLIRARGSLRLPAVPEPPARP